MKRYFGLCFFVGLICLISYSPNAFSKLTRVPAELPDQVAKLLETLPEKKLTLDLVLGLAMQRSDSFKSLFAQKLLANVPYEQSQIATEEYFSIYSQIGNDKKEPRTSFSSDQIQTKSYGLGLKKYFLTGTQLGIDLTHSHLNQTYSTYPAVNNFETTTTASLSQSLWKDALGKATRLGNEIGLLSQKAQDQGFEETVNQWTLGLVQIYYQAWLAQAQYETAKRHYQGRERLLKITEIKINRGTAEKPDLLQVKSAMLASKVQMEEAYEHLSENWKNLILNLNLPLEWTSVDASEIPIQIELTDKNTNKLCEDNLNKIFSKETLNPSNYVQQSTLKAEASALAVEKARWESYPDLQLKASIIGNGVDTSGSPTWSESSSLKHPAWSVGGFLSFPIGFHAEKAKRTIAIADHIRAEAQQTRAQDELSSLWLNNCSEYNQKVKAVSQFGEALSFQIERSKLEEARFKIGRASLLQVIQAGDDQTQTQSSFNQVQIAQRALEWKIKYIANQISSTLDKIKETLHYEPPH